MIIRIRRAIAAVQTRTQRVLFRFKRHEGGLAFIEFALVAPIMVAMYLGIVELSHAIGHSRKSALIARALADLTTQFAVVKEADVTDIFAAANSIMVPYETKSITMRITNVMIDLDGKAFADWSRVKSVTSTAPYPQHTRCADVSSSVPTNLRNPNTRLVLGESKIIHKPLLNYTFTTPIRLEERVPMMPRSTAADAVKLEGNATTKCPGGRWA